MGTLNMPPDRIRHLPSTGGESDLPALSLRPIPMPAKMPKDDLGRDIAFFLAAHADIAARYVPFNLERMTDEAKVRMLAEIKSALGIRPVKTRRPEYLGD